MVGQNTRRAAVTTALLLCSALIAGAQTNALPRPELPGRTPIVAIQQLGDQLGTYKCVNNDTHIVKHHRWCFCPTKRIVRGAWFCELTTSCTSCRPVGRQSPEPDPICGDAVPDLLPLLSSAPPAQTASVNEAQTAEECWEQGGVSFTEDILQGTTTCYFPSAQAP